ncbi:MAG: hypothetical protein H6726_11155 [Sandaracinaceae bacterium]|nr:hypothetical protein [Myxococcales bacterium]MCB9658197.1 hypothetical protein [Sandaracinaceae bacterium]
MMSTRTVALSLTLASMGCGGAAVGGEETTATPTAAPSGLGPFRLGMSAVDLRLACVDNDGSDWSPNQHAFTRGCEVTLDVQGITFQRFEMRLDGPSGSLVRLRGHADDADELAVRRAFPGADVTAVGDVVLVTLEAPTPAPAEAAHPPD